MNHAPAPHTDARPLYPEVIAFGAPRGARELLQSVAAEAGMSVSELIRRALDRAIPNPAGQPRHAAEA